MTSSTGLPARLSAASAVVHSVRARSVNHCQVISISSVAAAMAIAAACDMDSARGRASYAALEALVGRLQQQVANLHSDLTVCQQERDAVRLIHAAVGAPLSFGACKIAAAILACQAYDVAMS